MALSLQQNACGRCSTRPAGASRRLPAALPGTIRQHAFPRARVSAAAVETYQAPSNITGSNELTALSRMTNIVPDTLLLQTPVKAKAATVSSLVLGWVLSNEQLGMRPYQVSCSAICLCDPPVCPSPWLWPDWFLLLLSPQNAISASLNYSRCLALSGNDRLACQLDKAMANVGAMLAAEVEGRVCTEVDPRLCNDSSE